MEDPNGSGRLPRLEGGDAGSFTGAEGANQDKAKLAKSHLTRR